MNRCLFALDPAKNGNFFRNISSSAVKMFRMCKNIGESEASPSTQLKSASRRTQDPTQHEATTTVLPEIPHQLPKQAQALVGENAELKQMFENKTDKALFWENIQLKRMLKKKTVELKALAGKNSELKKMLLNKTVEMKALPEKNSELKKELKNKTGRNAGDSFYFNMMCIGGLFGFFG